jgi:hypothetical protein
MRKPSAPRHPSGSFGPNAEGYPSILSSQNDELAPAALATRVSPSPESLLPNGLAGANRLIDQPISAEQFERSLLDIAVESWRFSRVFSRVINRLDAGEANRYASQLRYFQKKLEDGLQRVGFEIVNVEGAEFDPGMAASALNLGDFNLDDKLLVDQMIEPIIVGPGGVKRQGTVMLRKAHG